MVVSLTRVRQRLRRHRRVMAALCTVMTLGVVAHHVMPEQAMAGHGMGDQHAMAAMTICLGVVAAVGLWAPGRPPRWGPVGPPARVSPPAPPLAPPTAEVVPCARAGPLGPVVLRL